MAKLVYKTTTTKEDYLYFYGIDLDRELEFVPNDVGDKPSARFIHEIEEFIKLKFHRWMNNKQVCSENCPNLEFYVNGNITCSKPQENNCEDKLFKTEWQVKCFKEAVCYQIAYVIINGSIHLKSGLIESLNQLISRAELERIGICESVYDALHAGGLYNPC